MKKPSAEAWRGVAEIFLKTSVPRILEKEQKAEEERAKKENAG